MKGFLGYKEGGSYMFRGELDNLHIHRTQMPHILEDLPHKMEGQPPQKKVNCVLGRYTTTVTLVFQAILQSYFGLGSV